MNGFVEKNYPFIMFFVLVFALHVVMGFNGDDIKFAKVLSSSGLLDYLTFRYHNWSSRLVIESVLVILARQNMIVWKVLDCIVSTVGVYYVVKLVNKSGSHHIAFLGVLLFLMYPFHEMASAGWISTTLNYSWCFSLGVIGLVPLIDRICGCDTHKIVYPISFAALLFAVNQEQSCAVIFALGVLYMVRMRELEWYNVFVIVLSFASLVFILTCPGNSVRFASEIIAWYPEFAHFGILDKIYLGVVPTFGLLLEQKIIFPLFYLVLSVMMYLKTKRRWLLYFNVFLIAGLVGVQTISDVSSILGFSLMLPVFDGFRAEALLWDIGALVVSLYLLLSSCVMLYLAFDRDIVALFVFVLGFVSKFVIGFSPVVFVSGPRTMMFFYFALISLVLLMVSKLFGEGEISLKWDRLITYSFVLLAGLNYLAVFGIVLWKYSII